jgi:hypothetical protein
MEAFEVVEVVEVVDIEKKTASAVFFCHTLSN